MDATIFRWVLIVIAALLALGIYFFGLYQARLRKRSSIETFTPDEVDAPLVEDEQLRIEMNNLDQLLKQNEVDETLDEIEINPAREMHKTPYAFSQSEIYVPTILESRDQDRLISYHLRHDDYRLITGEEADAAMQHTGLELNDEGLLEFCEQGEVAFQVASLTAPGNFAEIEKLDFTTLGFNCFLDLDSCENPGSAYETMLKKIDELVQILNVEVYKSDRDLLTIDDVSSVREKLS